MANLNVRSRPLRRPVLGVLLWCLVLLLGCADDAPACYDGEYQACTCGQAEGYAQCDAGRYGACDCASGTPGLGGAAANAVGGSGGAGGSEPEQVGYMDPCDDDEQCETGLCHPFNAKGPHCSQPCSDPSDCPPPSPGCNNMGICKVP